MESASVSVDVRTELARLQEREGLLTHLLQLEREKRIQAEQLVEVELQACLKLSQQLERQRRVTSCNQREEGVCSNGEGTNITQPGGSTVVAEAEVNDNEVSMHREEDSDSTLQQNATLTSLDSTPSDHSPETARLSPLSDNSFDFSSSVFSQLTSDLQQILGVGQSSDSTTQPSVTDAREAIKANNEQRLQECITSLQLDNDEGKSLLELASEHGYTGCVRVLLKGGCGLSTSSRTDGKTPVHLVAENGHIDSLNLLLSSGADPNVADSEDQTPLFLALKRSKTDCVDKLLHVGCLLQSTTKSGFNLLHAVVFGNVPSSLRLLLTHLRISLESSKVTQMINHADRDGRTPLHIAASRGQTECVQVLCACEELDTTRRDRWNRTPLDIATTECRELLLNRESKQAILRIKIPDSSTHVCYHDNEPSSNRGVAIGRIKVLRQHKLSDVEILVQQALEQYCNLLKGYPRFSTTANPTEHAQSKVGRTPHSQSTKHLAERILREYETSKHLIQPSSCMNEQAQDESIEAYREKCELILRENFLNTDSLDLSESSVSSYSVGSYEWKAGRLEKGVRMKSLLSVFGEMRGKNSGEVIPEVFITLKDAAEGCLDQLAFELMIPIAKLREYIELIEQHKTLMVHGAQGSGKTHLTISLAEYLKHSHGVEDTQVVHVSLHPSFQRDDLFRIFHLNGLLLPLEEEDGETMNRKTSTVAHALRTRTHVIILDDLSHISVPSVLAELLTSLSYRTPSHPMWVSNVYDREGTLLYPCGLYYLKEGSYFIATKTVASGEPLDASTFDQFPHISLGLCSEPTSGVLRRQLMTSLIDSRQGNPPHSSDPFYRLIQWLMEVWHLYNTFMLHMDLPELSSGLRHFLHFPLQLSEIKGFVSWVCSIWNHHLAPSIESHLSTHSDLISSPPTDIHRSAIISKMLVACSRMVFGVTCPLEHEAKLKMMDQLMSRLEGTVGSDGSPRVELGRKTVSEPIANGQAHSAVTPPTDSTPPPPAVAKTSSPSRRSRSQSEKPRKVTAAKPPPAPKAGNMVSYEDMIRNSPRSQARKNKNSKKENATKYATLQPDKPPPSSPIPGVTLRQDAGKNRTLRRLRSRTISLFSRDGSSTLPKLFRRGSRTSLVSLSEEDPFVKPTPVKQSPARGRKSQPLPSNHNNSEQLSDLFDMLSTSSRIDDQRSPPPRQVSISPSPSSASNTSVPRQTSKGVSDLDDLLNLLDTMGSSRIDDQRSPPPEDVQDETDDSTGVVRKYVIPTSSPKGERKKRRKGRVSALKSVASPPTSSMPDLTVREQSNVAQHVREHSDGSVFGYKTEIQARDEYRDGGMAKYGRHSVSSGQENSEYHNGYHNHSDHVPSDRAHLYHMYDYSAPSTEPLRHRSVDSYRAGNSAKSSPGMSYRSPTSPLAMTSYTTTHGPTSPSETSTVMDTKHGSVDSGSLSGFWQSHQHQYSYTDNSSVSSERVNRVSPSAQLENEQRHNIYSYTNGSATSSRKWSGDRIRARSASNLLDDVNEMNDIGEFDLFRASSEGDLLQSPTSGHDRDCVDYEEEEKRTNLHMESVYQEHSDDRHNNGHSVSFSGGHTPPSSFVACDHVTNHYGHTEQDSAYKSSLEDSYHSYTLPPKLNYHQTNGNTSDMNGYTEEVSSYPRERSNSVSVPPRNYSQNHELRRKISESKLSSSPVRINSNGNRRTSDTGSVFSASLAFSASLGFSPDSSLVKHSMSRDKLSSDLNEDHAEM